MHLPYLFMSRVNYANPLARRHPIRHHVIVSLSTYRGCCCVDSPYLLCSTIYEEFVRMNRSIGRVINVPAFRFMTYR